MMTFVIIIHAMVCVFLVIVILMQSGRGGGLTEQFASAENVFGAKTNVVMVRITSVFATIFIITSCTLAVLSTKRDESLMSRVKIPAATVNKVAEVPVQKDVQEKVDSVVKEVSQPIVQSASEAPKEVSPSVSSQPATVVPEPVQ